MKLGSVEEVGGTGSESELGSFECILAFLVFQVNIAQSLLTVYIYMVILYEEQGMG